MLIIRKAQLQALDQARRHAFLGIALAHFKDHDRDALLTLIEHAENVAQQTGIASHHGVLCLLEVMLQHGKDFDQHYRWARGLLWGSDNGDDGIRVVHEVLIGRKPVQGEGNGR